MYTGNNPIALQSQKMITDALLGLMEQKQFSKIQIKELCEFAQVSRQTFYSLYDNKEQVLELFFDQIFVEYIEKAKTFDKISVSLICSSSITYLMKYSHFINLLVTNNLNYIMTQKIEQYLLEFSNIISVNKPQNHDYGIAFLSSALVGVIGKYIQNNQFNNAKEISDLIENILSGNYFIVY